MEDNRKLLMVLVTGLASRLLTAFCLWFRSIVASNANLKFGSRLSKFVLFLVDSDFLFVNNGEKFEESVMNLRICSMYA